LSFRPSPSQGAVDDDDDGQDLVTKWRKRLPVLKILSGGPRGRELKPLREGVVRLQSKADTWVSANRLRNFYDTLMLVMNLRPEIVGSITPSELHVISRKVSPLHISFPLEVQMGLLHHKIAKLTSKAR